MQLQGCPNWQTTSTPGVNIFDGKAHLVTAVKSRDSVAFYIDGIHMPSAVSYCGSDPTAPVHSRFITTSNPYVIGYDSISGGTMSNYNGWISKARIWNVELSAAQVTANAGSVLSPQPGLVGYYLMRSKDTCTQAIADLSGYTSSTVTLDGSSSTGSISSYQWTKVSGPNNPVIVSPTAATTQVTGLISGIYAFQLSINGGSSTSQVSVYVNTAASANAAAGPNQSIFSPASSVTLNGSGSSGAITSYTWSLVSGPNSPIIVSPSSISTNVTGLIAGAYIFNLSLNGGASASQIKVYVLNTSTTSVFTTQTPASNSNAGMGIELGMRFRSKSAGYIKGVRFYKTTLNTGTHTGELYNNYGTRLAQATFTGETSSGWQTVLFSTPVYIKADTTYLAAYYSAAGNYSYTGGFSYPALQMVC